MKANRPLAALALALPIAAACNRSIPQPAPSTLAQACTVAATAASGQDDDIARLQKDLREGHAPARAAEQLGYRFISRARLSTTPGTTRWRSRPPLVSSRISRKTWPRCCCARTCCNRCTASRKPRRSRGAWGAARVRARLRAARRRADGTGRGGGGRGVSEHDRPQAVLPILRPRRSHALAQRRYRGRHRLDERAVKRASPRDPESAAWAYTRFAF